MFDLDGTLADTARDMVNSLNILMERWDQQPIPFETLRPHVSNGTPALLRIGFDCSPGEDRYEELRVQFLDIYENNVCVHTELFPGMDELLKRCDDSGMKWGIVTNKPEYLTLQLINELGLDSTAACVIGGDSLPERKPHPLPVQHACKLVGTAPECSLFIGDSIRDVQAGSGAGVETLAVTYGYIPPGDDPNSWGADFIVDSVQEINSILWESCD